MIRGLWYRQVVVINDVKLGDAGADTYKYEPMTVLLSRWEKINKDKHGKHCHDQRKFFCRLFSQWTEFLGGNPYLFSLN